MIDTSTMWYLSRATGIVAMILVVAALAWGFFFSARATGRTLRPAWWLDLHNWLGGLALIFTGVHIAAAWLDTNSGIGLLQIFVPGTTTGTKWPIAWGVLGTYLLAATVFTTWPRRLKRRRMWRVIHLSSVAATALALLHTYQRGSDTTRGVFQTGFVLAAAAATYALGLRLFSLQTFRGHRQTDS
jgi:methionine sulfoxide reductase heme-binding subunit